MPGVASLGALHRAVAEFVVTDLDLAIEPRAGVSATASRTDSPAAPERGERYGCTGTKASSYWTFP